MILDTRTAHQVAAALESKPRPSFWSRVARWFVGEPEPERARPRLSMPYRAAEVSRSKADWTRTGSGPNTTVSASRAVLVHRSRDMQRNDPHAARVVNVYVNHLVGTGLMAAAKRDGTPEGEALADQADAIYRAMAKKGVLDNTGQLTAEGLQAQEARALVGDGEVFIRRIYDREASPVPMRIAVLECDMLDASKDGISETGNPIVQGIEKSPTGRRVAYWFHTSHPGEASYAGASRSVRVPASEVIHLQLPGRPGQMRSVPLMSPVMATKRDLGDFENFTLIQKKTEALVVGVVTRQPYSEWNPAPEPAADPPGAEDEPDVLVPGVLNSDGDLVGDMRPGAFLGIDNGADIKFNQPQLAANYDTFKKTHLQSCAVGSGLSYEQLSGDFSNANYSTMRGGLLEFWAQIDALLWNEFAPAQDQVWAWIMEAAWLAGLIDRPDVGVEWQAPRRQSIEPDKDVIAEIMQVRAGWVDEDDVIAGYGYHPATLRKKHEANRKARERHGIISDADPAKYAWRGAFPPSVSPLAPGAPGAAEGEP